VHANPGLVALFEYTLAETEGQTLHFLYRQVNCNHSYPMSLSVVYQASDIALFEQCRMRNMRCESTDVTLRGYKKSGAAEYCRVITVPIRGGVQTTGWFT
jgi:hypothetical protein